MPHIPGHRESTGAKRWLEENISKKGISRAYNKASAYQAGEMSKEVIPGLSQGDLYGMVTGGVTGKASSLKGIYKAGKSIYSKWKGGKAVASTVSKEAVASSGKIFANQSQQSFSKKLFADERLVEGVGKRFAVNQEFTKKMSQANWKKLGKVQSPTGGNLDVSVADDLMDYYGRKMTSVMFSGKQGSILQPFYRSTGKGVPGIKSGGKFLPFEGILPKKLDIVVGGRKISGAANKGWVIKGFKQPGATKGKTIFGTSEDYGQGVKEGLKIHQDTGTMLQKYFK